MKHLSTPFVLLFILAVLACREPEPAAETGRLRLRLEHTVGDQPLQPASRSYTNAAGESFTVRKLDYYLTNVRLLRADGSAFTLPQDSSYFLVRLEDPASQVLALSRLPYGTYTAVEYLIGVDSLRQTMDVSRRPGVLDPANPSSNGMYWDWNSGYIHLKLEGVSPSAPVDATGERPFRYHVGLFGGYQARTLNNIRRVRVPLATPVTIGPGQQPTVVVTADLARFFDGPTPLSIRQAPNVMVSPLSAGIADNYARMFRFARLEPTP